MSGELVPSQSSNSSQAIPLWFCVGVSTSGVPYFYGPDLDDNDLLMSSRCLYFIFVRCGFGVVLGDNRSFIR